MDTRQAPPCSKFHEESGGTLRITEFEGRAEDLRKIGGFSTSTADPRPFCTPIGTPDAARARSQPRGGWHPSQPTLHSALLGQLQQRSPSQALLWLREAGPRVGTWAGLGPIPRAPLPGTGATVKGVPLVCEPATQPHPCLIAAKVRDEVACWLGGDYSLPGSRVVPRSAATLGWARVALLGLGNYFVRVVSVVPTPG